jgi:hypothetical protein
VVCGRELAGVTILSHTASSRSANIEHKAIDALALGASLVNVAPVGVLADAWYCCGACQAGAAGAAVAGASKVPCVAAAALVDGLDLTATDSNAAQVGMAGVGEGDLRRANEQSTGGV